MKLKSADFAFGNSARPTFSKRNSYFDTNHLCIFINSSGKIVIFATRKNQKNPSNGKQKPTTGLDNQHHSE